MSVYSFFRISRPAAAQVPEQEVEPTYRKVRRSTFIGVTAGYSLYYVCRMSLSVVKQPLIDGEVMTAGELGLIGSGLLLIYAFGKFINGFIADYCNIRRFMGFGLLLSSVINFIIALLGIGVTSFGMPHSALFFSAVLLWGMNGWFQSMGPAPGVISLSRWFPQSRRGTFYSIFCTSPYIGEFISFVLIAAVVARWGWEWGFLLAALIGFAGSLLIFLMVKDTPESCGLPSVQKLSGEEMKPEDSMKTLSLQKRVLRHPGIWIIAASSAFIYITKYAITGWGVLFLQKAKLFSLEKASNTIAVAALVGGLVGTVSAGWISDNLFKGDRKRPALLSGFLGIVMLSLFLFTGGGFVLNTVYVAVFNFAMGELYCIVAGLMAIDIVPRKATGAALGVVGVSSYVAAAVQDIASGYLIQENGSDFTAVSIFWIVAAFLATLLPVLNWDKMKRRSAETARLQD